MKDHNGTNFKDEKELCKYWGIDYEVYQKSKDGGQNMGPCLSGEPKE